MVIMSVMTFKRFCRLKMHQLGCTVRLFSEVKTKKKKKYAIYFTVYCKK